MLRTFISPIWALAEHWFSKALISALLSLFVHDLRLVVLIAFLVLIDLLTGMWRAIQEGTFTANNLRKTTGKVVSYVILLSVVGAISNSFSLLSSAITAAYAYVAITEGWSIIENISHEGGTVYQIWKKLEESMRSQMGLE